MGPVVPEIELGGLLVVFCPKKGRRRASKFGSRASKRRIDVCLANTLPRLGLQGGKTGCPCTSSFSIVHKFQRRQRIGEESAVKIMPCAIACGQRCLRLIPNFVTLAIIPAVQSNKSPQCISSCSQAKKSSFYAKLKFSLPV